MSMASLELNTTLSSAPAAPVAALVKHMAVVVSYLIYHTLIHTKTSSKAKPKEKKEMKMKELSHTFLPISENYITFLTAILAKHGDEKYKLTEKRRYGVKILCPLACTKADAIDIDNFTEFQYLCKTICNGKPNKLTIYADMADIEKSL
jgi:hypothetical protein